MKPWIGVDLDGTLARDDGPEGPVEIGAPIPAMVERVKRWLAEGDYDVKIFTARVSSREGEELFGMYLTIQQWCIEHIGQELEVTHCKDYHMIECWDDRSVQVEPNTGRMLGESRVI